MILISHGIMHLYPYKILQVHGETEQAMNLDGIIYLPAWEWDVSSAVYEAIKEGSQYVSFSLYSADTEYHTGKQFVQSNDFPDWGDQSQRPTLEVTVASPK